MEWETVIGLEVHAQLQTKSKTFSGAATKYGAEPNTQACAVDIALPGVLPVFNKEAVRMAVKFGLAIGAAINQRSVFARKNYFYPDLPKGYQISQYELPVVAKGQISVDVDGVEKIIGITRAHLEEDAGKSLHEDFHGMTGIDLNRAGTPLLEIVSEPDMRSPKEAVAYLKKLHELVRYLEICDGNMQEGSFRCDANVSVRPKGEKKFGTRAEIKNINSFRFVEKAIEFEVERQIDLLEGGGKVVQETRLYDSDKDETRSMRSKEEAKDYRYFPDPDLPPLVLDEAFIADVKKTLPELPDAKRARFMKDYGLTAYDAGVLTGSRELADYYEQVVRESEGRSQDRGQLGHGRTGGVPEPRQQGYYRVTGDGRHDDGTAQAPRRQHHLRQDRQGSLRGHVERRRRRRRRDREERPEADHRYRRDRKGHRRGHRQKPQAARTVPRRQGDAVRLFRRPGDEGLAGQGQPGAGQRAAEEKARSLRDREHLLLLTIQRHACLGPEVTRQYHRVSPVQNFTFTPA